MEILLIFLLLLTLGCENKEFNRLKNHNEILERDLKKAKEEIKALKNSDTL